jgi:hypothetical protein
MYQSPDRIISFLRNTLDRYPLSTSRDIYKLLYQSYHGAEHAVSDGDEARKWLEEEWSGLTIAGKDIPLVEPIFIEGITPDLYRINLVPARSSGIDPETILDEFLRTAAEFPTVYPGPDDDLHEKFIDAWKKLAREIEQGGLGLRLDDFREITSLAESNNWPVMHHSDIYRESYNPHYRLIMDPYRILPRTDFPLE